MLIRQGMPLKKIAELFNTSYAVIYRLTKSQGVELLRSERKLTPGQLADAYDLLRVDVPFRQVAQQYSIHPESLRRLALRDGVVLGARGQKLTPTQRKLTPEQRREVHVLAQLGISHRQIARQLGISRGAVRGLLS